MIGYGFMARVHSNAWRQVGRFFPELAHRPVLQAVAGRDAARVSRVRRRLGLSERRDRLAAAGRARRHRSGRHLRAEPPALRDCARGGRGRQDDRLREAARDQRAEGEAMVEAVEAAGVANLVWYNYRRVPAITLASQLIDEGRIGRPFHYRAQFLQDWTIAPDVPQGGPALWRLDVKRGLGRDRRPARPLHRHRDLAERPDHSRDRRDRDLREGAPPPGNRKGRAGRDRRRLHGHGALCQWRDGPVREHPLRPRPQGASIPSSSTARPARLPSTCTIPSGSRSSNTATPQWREDRSHTAGWRKIHVTGSEHPYMSHWWVPGLSLATSTASSTLLPISCAASRPAPPRSRPSGRA